MPQNRTLSHILKKEPQSVTIKTKRTRAKVQCHCDKCKRKLVDLCIKKKHDNEISSQISVMNTSQEVYEDIDTDELSHSVLSGQNEISMQNVERSVDIEEVQQNITDDNLCDKNNFDFLPREHILRYTKISANFNINDFERSESEP